jgi:hypothetical protein
LEVGVYSDAAAQIFLWVRVSSVRCLTIALALRLLPVCHKPNAVIAPVSPHTATRPVDLENLGGVDPASPSNIDVRCFSNIRPITEPGLQASALRLTCDARAPRPVDETSDDVDGNRIE